MSDVEDDCSVVCCQLSVVYCLFYSVHFSGRNNWQREGEANILLVFASPFIDAHNEFVRVLSLLQDLDGDLVCAERSKGNTTAQESCMFGRNKSNKRLVQFSSLHLRLLAPTSFMREERISELVRPKVHVCLMVVVLARRRTKQGKSERSVRWFVPSVLAIT